METMRVLVAGALCVACGGRDARPVAAKAPERQWDAARVLETVPHDAQVVAVANMERLRRSALIAPHWKEILRLSRTTGSTGAPDIDAVCPHLVNTGSTLIMMMGPMTDRSNRATMWSLDVPARETRDCTVKAVTPGTGVVIASTDDYAQVRLGSTELEAATLVVDSRTTVVRLGVGLARAAVARALEPAPRRLEDPMLDWLRTENPTAWMIYRPAERLVIPGLAAPVVRAGISAEVSSQLVLHARVEMPDPAAAQALVDLAKPYVDRAVQMQWVDEHALDIRGSQVHLRVVLERATIERIIATVRSTLPP